MSTPQQAESFFDFCENEGIKLSAKCKVLIEGFCRTDNYIDAESLWFKIKNEGEQISRATVYASLSWLCNKGYVCYKKEKGSNSKVYRINLPD